MKRKYSKQAEKFLDSQNTEVYERIKSGIKKLPQGDVKRIKPFKDKYRLRVGDYRIIFRRIQDCLYQDCLYIETIDNRGQVYKR